MNKHRVRLTLCLCVVASFISSSISPEISTFSTSIQSQALAEPSLFATQIWDHAHDFLYRSAFLLMGVGGGALGPPRPKPKSSNVPEETTLLLNSIRAIVQEVGGLNRAARLLKIDQSLLSRYLNGIYDRPTERIKRKLWQAIGELRSTADRWSTVLIERDSSIPTSEWKEGLKTEPQAIRIYIVQQALTFMMEHEGKAPTFMRIADQLGVSATALSGWFSQYASGSPFLDLLQEARDQWVLLQNPKSGGKVRPLPVITKNKGFRGTSDSLRERIVDLILAYMTTHKGRNPSQNWVASQFGVTGAPFVRWLRKEQVSFQQFLQEARQRWLQSSESKQVPQKVSRQRRPRSSVTERPKRRYRKAKDIQADAQAHRVAIEQQLISLISAGESPTLEHVANQLGIGKEALRLWFKGRSFTWQELVNAAIAQYKKELQDKIAAEALLEPIKQRARPSVQNISAVQIIAFAVEFMSRGITPTVPMLAKSFYLTPRKLTLWLKAQELSLVDLLDQAKHQQSLRMTGVST